MLTKCVPDILQLRDHFGDLGLSSSMMLKCMKKTGYVNANVAQFAQQRGS
jgi:hypothetical protein